MSTVSLFDDRAPGHGLTKSAFYSLAYHRAMTESGDEDDDFEPLECLPLPVSIEAYDADISAPATVRLFFTPRLGADPRPGNELSDVVVLEQWDRVAIGLVRRVVQHSPCLRKRSGRLAGFRPSARSSLDTSRGQPRRRAHREAVLFDDLGNREPPASGSEGLVARAGGWRCGRAPLVPDQSAQGVREPRRHDRSTAGLRALSRGRDHGRTPMPTRAYHDT